MSKKPLTEEDYAELDAQGCLPVEITPALIRYCAKHGSSTKVIKTDHGTVYECDNYIRQAAPEELQRRREDLRSTAARLRDELAGVKRGVWT